MDNPDALFNLSGNKVALGPLRRDLLPFYYQWGNDFAVTRTTASSRPLTLEEFARSYEEVTSSPHNAFFTVYELEHQLPIGQAYLTNIDFQHQTAAFGIAIGNTDYHGRGYGTEATRLVLRYAFSILGLHNVMLEVYEFNEAGIRAYEKAGFRQCGRRREAHRYGQRLWDVILMECLASEFRD